jgi:hypothetical protein
MQGTPGEFFWRNLSVQTGTADRFEMAQARVEWAAKRLGEFHDLLGRFVSGHVPLVPVQVSIAEVFGHLRPALDYCARQLRDLCPPGTPAKPKPYFPIGDKGEPRQRFLEFAERAFPGLPTARPDLWAAVESFQVYSSPANEWLPEFKTLSNDDKHEELSVQRAARAPCRVGEHEGKPVFEVKTGDKVPVYKGLSFGVVALPLHGEEGFDHTAIYLWFSAIDREASGFLQRTLDGVRNIVETLRKAV